MKRLFALLLTLVMALTLCACGGETDASQGEDAVQTTAAAEGPWAEDIFAVEQVGYRHRRGEFQNFEIKIRNLTDEKLLDMYFSVQALDEAGDVVESWNMGSSDALDPGQGYWYYCNSSELFGECTTIQQAAEQADSIRIVYAKIQTVRGDPTSWVQYDFREPPTFKVADIQARGRNMDEPLISAETEPEGPRVMGPEERDGKALTIKNVSVEFLDELPRSVTSSSSYSHSGNKEDFVLNGSQVYSAISFTITNKTTEEIKVADIQDNFMVDLVYDSGFTYSSNSEGYCFFQSGSQNAVVSRSSSIGKVTLAPLVTADVTVYIPCAREVAENEDKILDVVFTSMHEDLETYRFAIR